MNLQEIADALAALVPHASEKPHKRKRNRIKRYKNPLHDGRPSSYRKSGPGRVARSRTFDPLFHNKPGSKLVHLWYGEQAAKEYNA